MTLPADNTSENDNKSEKSDGTEAGTALATAAAGPINPFLAAAAEKPSDTAVPPRAFVSRMLDYSAHAAIIVGLIGFAWTVGDHVVNRPVAKNDSAVPVAAAAIPQPMDEMAQLRLANQKMHDEIKALKTSVETLRTTVRRDTTPEQVRMLSAGLETVKGSVSSASAAIAQLNGKVEKLQPGKMQALTERVGRLEHQALDTASTASIAKSDLGKSDPAPKPPVKPASLGADDTPAKGEDKPQVITGWVVRDVYQGVALVEGKRGTMEIVPGVAIPGAGVVKSIERHGSGWTVTTTKGQFASAAPSSAVMTQRDYRRGPYGYQRGGYPPYRYDY